MTRVVYLTDSGGKLCPSCSNVLSKEFDYCPTCGEFVGDHCERCRRRVHPQWTYCPFCGGPTHAVEGERKEGAADPERSWTAVARRMLGAA